ncbi:hypothetical protein [Terasakiella sp. SH-1]|uniref:hypothetical protein n=1 Tax=Terasakiella sp. SH-1 TaxID=2560057 RepID=UPI001073D677|nr:hypothetical protein [Terasakiella sp. SH-1]
MFAGKAYQEGLDCGDRDARAGKEQRRRPSFWKALLGGSAYTTNFIRGYNDGYRSGCRGKKIEEHRAEEWASRTERYAQLGRGRMPGRVDEREH